jgi:hypothetical protein
MNKTKSILARFTSSYVFVGSAVRQNPKILYPFLIFAGLELLSLIFLYLIPRMPLRTVFGPIITTFWGDQYLHYPQNFLLLPKLASLARSNLSVLFGSLLTGVAVAFLYKMSFAKAFQKYINLLFIVFILTFSYFIFHKAVSLLLLKYFATGHEKLLFWGPDLWLGPIQSVINQTLVLILQALFIYAIPILLTTDKKFIAAILASFRFFFKNMGISLLFAGVPMVIVSPLIFLNYNGVYLMVKIAPEVILWLGVASVVANSLILDPLITLTTAAYYLANKDKK